QKLTLNEALTAESLGSKESMERQLAHTSEIDIVQAILKNITLLQTDIWYTLTEADKYLFLDKYYKTWDKLRAPFPPETGKNIVDAWGKNKFQVYDNLVLIYQNYLYFTFNINKKEYI